MKIWLLNNGSRASCDVCEPSIDLGGRDGEIRASKPALATMLESENNPPQRQGSSKPKVGKQKQNKPLIHQRSSRFQDPDRNPESWEQQVSFKGKKGMGDSPIQSQCNGGGGKETGRSSWGTVHSGTFFSLLAY